MKTKAGDRSSKKALVLVGMMAWQLKGYAACGICIYIQFAMTQAKAQQSLGSAWLAQDGSKESGGCCGQVGQVHWRVRGK